MRSKAEIFQQYYGVDTAEEAWPLHDEQVFGQPYGPPCNWVKLIIPYKAPGAPELPSIAEVDEAVKVALEKRSMYLRRRGNTQPSPIVPGECRIGNIVVKQGSTPRILIEAENIMFLQEHSRIRTPKLYAVHVETDGPEPVYYLFREYLEGKKLSEEAFKAMSEEDQKMICSSINEQFQLLRSVAPPSEEYFGRPYHQSFEIPMIPFTDQFKGMRGPYSSYDDFIAGVYACSELCMALSQFGPDFNSNHAKFLSEFKSGLGNSKARKSVLTHVDPRFENMVARPIKGEGDGEEIKDWEVTLVGWDNISWLPLWWQRHRLECSIYFDYDPLGKEMREKVWGQILAPSEESVSYSKELEFLNTVAYAADWQLL